MAVIPTRGEVEAGKKRFCGHGGEDGGGDVLEVCGCGWWWCWWWCSGVQGCKGTMTSKEYLFTCFMWVCYCVVWVFLYHWQGVPFRGGVGVWWWGVSVGVLWWCGGAGGGEGLAGDTPLFIWIVGTIRGFGMQKFFFEFWGRLTWCGAECGGDGAEG